MIWILYTLLAIGLAVSIMGLIGSTALDESVWWSLFWLGCAVLCGAPLVLEVFG